MEVRFGNLGVVLVGVRRRPKGARLAEPLGELGEALCVHVLRVHEEGTARGAPVMGRGRARARARARVWVLGWLGVSCHLLPCHSSMNCDTVSSSFSTRSKGGTDSSRRSFVSKKDVNTARAWAARSRLRLSTMREQGKSVRLLGLELAARIHRGDLEELLEAVDLVRRVSPLARPTGPPGHHRLLAAERVLEDSVRLRHEIGRGRLTPVPANELAHLGELGAQVLEHSKVLAGERDAGQSVQPLEERRASGAATGGQDKDVLLRAEVAALLHVVSHAALVLAVAPAWVTRRGGRAAGR
eukprot:scaffold81841_cov46-Phaeocystis_antarctica.AAC.3